MTTTIRKTIFWSTLAIPAVALLLPTGCFGQAAPADSGTPAPASGLDAFIKESEPKVLDEMVNDGLDALLTREFDVDNTPDKQRRAIQSIKAMRLLNDPNAQLSGQEQLKLAGQAAQGLQDAKSSLPKDAHRLEKYAETLINAAGTYYESNLEYWGEDPVTQDQFLPIAKTITDLYTLASQAAEDQCAVAAGANKLPEAQALDQESQSDTYLANIYEYDVALATDASSPEGLASRKTIAAAAIEALAAVDDPTTGAQPFVELIIAKNRMISGDYAKANKLLDNLIGGTTTPPPTPIQQNAAYYFKAVGAVLAKDATGAKKAQSDLTTFQQGLPAILSKAGVNDAAITQAMSDLDTQNHLLQYRIDLLSNDLMGAQTVLMDLKKKHPELGKLIDQQLINTLPPSQSVATMDPLLLNAVMNKAATEQHRDAKVQDKKVMQRGLDAAIEVIGRTGKPGITPEFVLYATKLKPVLQDSLGQAIPSINSYLDFVDQYKDQPAEKDDADGMLQNAYAVIQEVRKIDPQTPGLGPADERFLKTAVAPPLNHTVFCYYYAALLQGKSDFAGAAEQYKLVPKNDPNFDAARYQLMIVLNELVNTPTTDQAAHKAQVDDLSAVAVEIKDRYSKSASKDDRFKAAYATVTAAGLAIDDQHDPQKALDLLDGFEQAVAGVDQEPAFIVKALFIRYGADVALHQTDKVNADLVAIVKNSPGDTGIKLVDDQLMDLEKQFAKAQAAGDVPQMRQISRMQAQLSGYLANWAKDNTNPANKKAYYGYAVFDAKIKRIAGSLEDDPAAKTADLKAAQTQFDFLASPQGHALYVAQLDPAKGFDPSQPDTYVLLGQALTQYAMQDYADAQKGLGFLLVNKRLGDTSSDAFWEATLAYYDSNFHLGGNLDDTKRGLKGIYIIGGIPAKWQSAFDKLREQMIPDWKVPDSNTAAASK